MPACNPAKCGGRPPLDRDRACCAAFAIGRRCETCGSGLRSWLDQTVEQATADAEPQRSTPGVFVARPDRLYEGLFFTKAESMSIGLNLCRTIVELHCGRMQAENIYNGPDVIGCRFSSEFR